MIKKIAVIGTGVIGTGWIVRCLAHNKKVIDGDRTRVRQLELEPGDLQIFKGRFTLHRVTKIEGNRSRYLCIPAYVLDPWRVNTPEHSKSIYGKVLPIHIERNRERADGLAD